MSSTATTTTTEATSSTAPIKVNVGRLQCTGNEAPFGDFRDDLVRDGYAVVKGAIPADRAAGYAEEMYEWLEGFNLGFNRHDISTYTGEHLPVINEKGMVMEYSVPHENFVWQVRSEPGVIGAFEKVYDTKDLIVSFDAVNFTLPHRTDLPENKPWPHQDQDPEKHGFRCLQGLVNLLPNGPDDGGLIVCKGAHLLSTEFHKVFAEEEKIWAWTKEWYGFTDAGLAWLKSKGCVWEKICAEPGDLLLWDSRTPHYNLSSKTDNPRFAMYTCYMPVSDASQEDLKRKKDAFERRVGTTHWPNAEHVGSNVMMIENLEKRLQVREGGVPDPYNRVRPVKEPVLSERAFKLTGIPYIKE